jgi:hypothetical protein
MEKLIAMLIHAVQMIRKNAKNYALLSVTVVLSFSGLLAYLMYTDSSLYNDYKDILSRDSHVILVPDTYNALNKERALLEVSQRDGLKASYVRQQIMSRTTKLNESHNIDNSVFVTPNYVWGLYEDGHTKPYQITWLDGREEKGVSLGLNEILIPRSLYQLLGMDRRDAPTYELWLQAQNHISSGTQIYFPVVCRITGLIEDGGVVRWSASQEGESHAWFPTYISQATVEVAAKNADPAYLGRDIILYTDNPAAAEQRIGKLGLSCISTYRQQQDATRELQIHSQTKAMITLALFVVLTINLYGCFMNALEHRKFEVGVKRAIGASGGAIMGQFLFEGILVMLCNLILSVALVVDGFLIYKYFYQKAYGVVWTITLSGESIGMFVSVGICLTLLFSALFAYKSTQVEVVKQLKAE